MAGVARDIKYFFSYGDPLGTLLSDQNTSDEEKRAALNDGEQTATNVLCPIICAPWAVMKCLGRVTCRKSEEDSEELSTGVGKLQAMREVKEAKEIRTAGLLVAVIACLVYGITLIKQAMESTVLVNISYSTMYQPNQAVEIRPALPSWVSCGMQDIGAFYAMVQNRQLELRFEHRGEDANGNKIYGNDDLTQTEFKCYNMELDFVSTMDEVKQRATRDARCDVQNRRTLSSDDSQSAGDNDSSGGAAASTTTQLNAEVYYDGYECIMVYVPPLATTHKNDIYTVSFNSMSNENQPTHGSWFWPGEKNFWPMWGENKFTFQFGDDQRFALGTSTYMDYLYSMSRQGDPDQPGTRAKQEETMVDNYDFSKHGRFVSENSDKDKYKMTWRMRLSDTVVPTYWYSLESDGSALFGSWMGAVSGAFGIIAFVTPILLLGFSIPIINIAFRGYAPHVSYEIKLMEDVKNANALNKVLCNRLKTPVCEKDPEMQDYSKTAGNHVELSLAARSPQE